MFQQRLGVDAADPHCTHIIPVERGQHSARSETIERLAKEHRVQTSELMPDTRLSMQGRYGFVLDFGRKRGIF